MSRDRPRAPMGFTIVELLVTVVVLAIVMAAAVPTLSTLIAQSRITTSVNGLVGTLASARSMAVTGRGMATVCSNNGGACGSSSQWSAGALVFADRDGNRAINGTEKVFRRQDGITNLNVSANVSAVTFQPDGSARTDDSSLTMAQWLFCDPAGRAKPRILTLQIVGSVSTRQPDSCSL